MPDQRQGGGSHYEGFSHSMMTRGRIVLINKGVANHWEGGREGGSKEKGDGKEENHASGEKRDRL